MTIKEVEKETGISKVNIRYYEKEGLLNPKRETNNYREYTPEDAEVLLKIKLLRILDVPVAGIKQIQGGSKNISEMMHTRVEQISAEVNRLQEIQKLCTEMEQQNWSFESIDFSLMELKEYLIKEGDGMFLRKERGINQRYNVEMLKVFGRGIGIAVVLINAGALLLKVDLPVWFYAGSILLLLVCLVAGGLMRFDINR